MSSQEVGTLESILIEKNLITEAQMGLAQEEQKRTGDQLSNILQRLGFVNEEQLTACLASRIGAEFMRLKDVRPPIELLAIVSEDFAREHKVIPVSKNDDVITVAMVDVLNVVAIDQLQQLAGCMVDAKAATETDVLKTIDRIYVEEAFFADGDDKEDAIDKSIAEAEKIDGNSDEEGLATPIITLVNQTLYRGIKLGATDIHLEPNEHVLRTRFRIDGVMQQGPSFPKKLQSAVTTRVKILSDLNVSECRVPQDGKIRFTMDNKRVDMRVSTLPTIFGEAVVIRVLDKSKVLVGLDNLGFMGRDQEAIASLLKRPNGIILVTGPTGSGKTTTLYTALSSMNSLEETIITLEDPVEYELSTIRQCQINVKAGMTFAAGLRSILRQDPDVILLGEMRDTETAEMAVRAALTGHLVFSTLHTNDAARAIPRLVDMGITPLMIASSLEAVIAQRLIRSICEDCKEEYTPDMELIEKYNVADKLDLTKPFYHGKGCARCNFTGYKGRRGIFEILLMDKDLTQLIVHNLDPEEIKKVACAGGMTSMIEDGLKKAANGVTTLEEVLKQVAF